MDTTPMPRTPLYAKIKEFCDTPDNPFKAIALLSELIDDKFEFMQDQFEREAHKGRLANADVVKELVAINDKIDKFSDLHISCPVFKNKPKMEFVMFFIKYPVIFLILVVGMGTLFGLSFEVSLPVLQSLSKIMVP
jgi:hypothetical protein